MITAIRLMIFLSFIMNTVVFALPKYSPETIKLGREAGLNLDEEVPLEEIMRRQEAYNRKKELRRAQENSTVRQPMQTMVSGQGAIFSYDEFHIRGNYTAPNDGYKSGGFDELHINENYKQNVYHPEHRGFRMEGFDEFRYVDEM